MKPYKVERFTHAGLTVRIIQDEDAQSPENDDGLFIVTTRNRYFQLLQDDRDCGQWDEDKEASRKYWRFPLYAYIHSGVALSLGRGGQFSDPWDSGRIGTVYVSKSEWRYQFKERKSCVSAFKAATSYMEAWNQYLSGDVWGVVIESQGEDEDEGGEQLDSCWGFYGLDYAKQEGREMAEGCARSIAKVDRMEAETFAL